MRKSKPILFSPAMVQAILDGNKTQTRRVLKHTTEHEGPYNSAYIEKHIKHTGWKEICPHGKIGDLLWVREEHYRFGHWRPVPGVKTKGGRQKWAFIPDAEEVLFKAPEQYRKGRHSKDPETKAWHKRLARFMPRSLCRLQLEIKDIRVEALHDMSEEDAVAEGITGSEVVIGVVCYGNRPIEQSAFRYFVPKFLSVDSYENAVDAFEDLWTSINGAGSYALNPWVWVLEFKVAK